MLTEQYKDYVYFSSLLKIDYPKLYKELTSILSAHKISHGNLTYTKDYWCRDYMPVQYGIEFFAQFKYDPDYLRNQQRYWTNTDFVVSNLRMGRWDISKTGLVADGGNVVFCEEDTRNLNCKRYYLVMTDKVLVENPIFPKRVIEQGIRKTFCDNDLKIVWLPWRHSDLYGHSDGILRYVGKKGGKPIVLTNLSLFEKDHAAEINDILNNHFYVMHLELSEYDDLSWAYINALQMRDVIIIPGIGNCVTDREALEQYKKLYPAYGDNIYQVQMRDFIQRWGGALNCCTWTISKEMSGLPHNKSNDERYEILKQKALKNEERLSLDELYFLGDYYPLKLESISFLLDKCYYGF